MTEPEVNDANRQLELPPARARASGEVTVAHRWWSAREAAKYIGAGPKEIYKAVSRGDLRAVRLNRRGDIRTTQEWIDEWMCQKSRDVRASD